METNQDRINRLNAELEREKNIQKNCQHEWCKPFKKEFTEWEKYATGEYEAHGSDFYPKTSFRDKIVYKWVRKCSICGLEQITEKTKVVKTETAPDFD